MQRGCEPGSLHRETLGKWRRPVKPLPIGWCSTAGAKQEIRKPPQVVWSVLKTVPAWPVLFRKVPVTPGPCSDFTETLHRLKEAQRHRKLVRAEAVSDVVHDV